MKNAASLELLLLKHLSNVCRNFIPIVSHSQYPYFNPWQSNGLPVGVLVMDSVMNDTHEKI
jgi:hypothetical protein